MRIGPQEFAKINWPPGRGDSCSMLFAQQGRWGKTVSRRGRKSGRPGLASCFRASLPYGAVFRKILETRPHVTAGQGLAGRRILWICLRAAAREERPGGGGGAGGGGRPVPLAFALLAGSSCPGFCGRKNKNLHWGLLKCLWGAPIISTRRRGVLTASRHPGVCPANFLLSLFLKEESAP